MANLLDLVEVFIGDLLHGNVYTDVSTFSSVVGPLPPSPSTTADLANDPRLLNFPDRNEHPHGDKVGRDPSKHVIYDDIKYGIHNPGNDPRLLNFQPNDPHPHGDKVGTDPKKHVIYASETRPLHDNRPDFLDPTPRAGQVAAQTPGAKRSLFYHPETPRPDVGQQIDTSKTLEPKIPRDQIYSDSRSFNRVGGPPSDPLNFNDTLPHPHTDGKLIPSGPPALNAESPGYVNKSGFHPSQHGQPPNPPATPQNYDAGSTPLRTWDNIEGVKRDVIYQGPPPPDVLDQRDSVKADASLAKGQSFDPVRRDNTYKQDFINPNGSISNAKQVVSNIGGTPESVATLGDQQAAIGKPPAPSLKFKGGDAGDTPDISKLQDRIPAESRPKSPFADQSAGGLYGRDDIASKKFDEKGVLKSAEEHGLINKNVGEGYRGGNLYDGGDASINPFGSGGTYRNSAFVGPLKHFDIFAIASWLKGIAREMGVPPIPLAASRPDNNNLTGPRQGTSSGFSGKGLEFTVTQLALTLLNPTDAAGYGELNAIWNPLSFALNLLPLRGVVPGQEITLGAAAAGIGFGGYKKNVIDNLGENERLRQMRDGKYEKSLDGNQVLQGRFADSGFKGDPSSVSIDGTETIQGKGLLSGLFAALDITKKSIAEIVDSDASKGVNNAHSNIYNSERPYGTNGENAVFPLKQLEEQSVNLPATQTPEGLKLQSLFIPAKFPGGDPVNVNDKVARTWIAAPRTRGEGVQSADMTDAPGINAATTNAAFNALDESFGVLDQQMAENETYMPFMFQDLRDDPPEFLYFRAFLKPGISETFAPEWQIERFYGRVDQVPVYMGTMRNLTFAFDVVAWSPKDLPVIYKKLEKLQSMVYPTFDMRGFMQSGPITRLRIGDLFVGAGKKGLPGYITSMDWTFEDGIWNIKDNFKVPRMVTVSIAYTVLHDGNPGIYPYASADIAPDGGVVQTGEKMFGAGRFTTQADGVINATVSREEIRGIFETVRNG